MPTINLQDRRVQIGLGVAALLLVALLVWVLMPKNDVVETADTAPATSVPGAPGAAAPTPFGAPGVGAAPGQTAGVTTTAPGGRVPGAPGNRQAANGEVQNSFSGLPTLLKSSGGGGGAPAGGGGFGGYPGGAGGSGYPSGGGGGGFPGAAPPASGGGGAAAGGGAKPAPVQPGRRVAAARTDPFVSLFKAVFKRPAAFTLVPPVRLASYPRPELPVGAQNPEQILGPLPYVPRRVAGVLYDGQVSAIMELGNPGAAAEYFIVQPGAAIPSGVPGVGDLTVTTITPTKVVLRAPDRRTVEVDLSGAANLPNAAGGGLGAGVPGGPGIPGAGFPGGGGRVGAPGLGGAGAADF